MADAAGSAVEIMAGSGIDASNALTLLRATGITALHASCSAALRPASIDRRAREFGFAAGAGRHTDADLVAALVGAARG